MMKLMSSFTIPPAGIRALLITIGIVLLGSFFSGNGAVFFFRRQETTKPHSLVLVMGLPRSGSLSIHNFFTCNQVPSRHYCCGGDTQKTGFPCDDENNENKQQTTCGACVHDNLLKNRPAFDGCSSSSSATSSDVSSSTMVYSQFDVETGGPFSWFLPQHFALPLLYKHSPVDTVWILNRRSDARQWAASVLHWLSVSTRLFHAFNISYWSDLDESSIPIALKQKVTEQDLVVELQESSIPRALSDVEHERRLTVTAQIYENHWQKIRDYAKRHSITLVQVEVDDTTSTSKLLVETFGGRESCYKFDPKSVDDDWKDFSLKV